MSSVHPNTTSNESDYRKWQSSPRYDCVTIPHVSPPPPDYMYKVKCHQEASAVILHCPSDRALGLSEIEVYNQEGMIHCLEMVNSFFYKVTKQIQCLRGGGGRPSRVAPRWAAGAEIQKQSPRDPEIKPWKPLNFKH